MITLQYGKGLFRGRSDIFTRGLGIGNYFNFRVDDGIRYTNANSTDTDGDGLSDREEFYFGVDGYLTDPTNFDTDGDGLNDYLEWSVYGTDQQLTIQIQIVSQMILMSFLLIQLSG